MHHDVKVIPSVVSILSWFRAVMLDTVIAWLTNMHCVYNVIYWYCSIAMGVDLCLVRLRCFALCASIESVCILESVCSSLCALWCAVIQSFSSCNHPPWPHTDPPITLRKISSEKKEIDPIPLWTRSDPWPAFVLRWHLGNTIYCPEVMIRRTILKCVTILPLPSRCCAYQQYDS